ncbi:MAG TPA: penicillin-binding transpeptidase domain-containing protein, partial [Elusimicrobiales bacterium]|nr:penicillin-binding transpeptidase domain-containing protein [Elusimicrobiales bacterium]
VATTVCSTLDAQLQRFATEALRSQLRFLDGQNVRDAAAIIVHNKTGEILAYVGNIRESENISYVDGVEARRQAGSTLKPFIYALAFEKKIL